MDILVPRGRAPFGKHQESRLLAMSKTESPRFTDFLSLYACSEPSLPNLIGSGLNLLCLQSHSKPECRWTRTEVAILGADQKERGLWGREWRNEIVQDNLHAHAQNAANFFPQNWGEKPYLEVLCRFGLLRDFLHNKQQFLHSD